MESRTALQIHLIDANTREPTEIEEILEIFVRVNSGGLVLQKSDLLMSLLDLKWTDVQPEIYRAVKRINTASAFTINRDDVLKSVLLANGSESRFDRLVSDRARVERLASELPQLLPSVETAWRSTMLLLSDNCRIRSERFLRGGHNSLLPFVHYFRLNPSPSDSEKLRLVTAVYITLMSGVFAGAEARMSRFVRDECLAGKPFPLKQLARLAAQHYGIGSLDDLLSRHLDLALNIAHDGITLDSNPESLQRDHIFPRATLVKQQTPPEQVNHYANFHFLRATDNLNKSDTAPDEWFDKPGNQPPYSDDDLRRRLLTRDLIRPGRFSEMLDYRKGRIQEKAFELFGMDSLEFERLFASH